MRLTEIKLAGFKSFVDPTRITVPGQRVGIVGPNGCGKSNIIDAVRWVLGESSARHLRGESMQDVLFNGSGNRQPVNRASVELVFDNSLGKAGGQWSSYGEIAIKRVLERDGDSSYYINNIHVRRRDIADIFLGTGVGARAYAIIEQGMISRVIEAKPEELRIFLEEAAGVSKYRERRKETESRLSDTRENLLRVEDIRQELDKQLTHLAEQAEVAQRYHDLQGRLSTAQNLLALQKKRDAAAARERWQRDLEQAEIALEAETARLRETEARLETLRTEHYAAGDAAHAAQGVLYEANAEFARIEQQIRHMRENRARVEAKLAGLRGQQEQGAAQLEAQQISQTEWTQELELARARCGECEAVTVTETDKLPLAEQAYADSQGRRDALQQEVSANTQAAQVEQTRHEHAEKTLAQLGGRGQRLREEQSALVNVEAAELERLSDSATRMNAEHGSRRAELEAEETAIEVLDEEVRGHDAALDEAREQAASIEARRATLVQIQERIARGEQLQGWLESHGARDARRLWQDIEIENGWEDALEAVLRERLNGIAVTDSGRVADWLRDPPPGRVTVYGSGEGGTPAPQAPSGLRTLSTYVRCKNTAAADVLNDWLHQVYVVDSADEGRSRAAALPPGAVLVSAQGHIYTRSSVILHAPAAADGELHGVLSRQREIEQLDSEISRLRETLAGLTARHQESEAELDRRRAALADLRAGVDATRQAHHEAQLAIIRLTEQAQRATERGAQIAAELAEIEGQEVQERARRDEAATVSQRLQSEGATLRERHAGEAASHGAAQAALESQRQVLQQVQRATQEAAFHQRSCEAKLGEIGNALGMLGAAAESVRGEIEQHEQELAGLDETPLTTELDAALAVRTAREQALAAARDALEAAETALRAAEQQKLETGQNLEPLRVRIGEAKLKEQEARIGEEQYAAQLAEAQADEAALALQLEEVGKRATALAADITRLANEIKALGAVNLAALEELTTTRDRKQYLDAQSADLMQALQTLEDAIRKIDLETRQRLQETFDKVNEHFGKLFPTLFGGGQAKLVLTGEEILDSGVQVIAQPPGKKNSSIHLLSGGEKALTAMSLVFALFQLNPAPFCLLDEVDAPLDDTNTERFCKLVQTMSANSQFLYISHNKITMEMANQLIGITMQEPGVSRIVAVDIEEALKMAQSTADKSAPEKAA